MSVTRVGVDTSMELSIGIHAELKSQAGTVGKLLQARVINDMHGRQA